MGCDNGRRSGAGVHRDSDGRRHLADTGCQQGRCVWRCGGQTCFGGGCADLADPVADYVPPPTYYAPMPDGPPPAGDYDHYAPPPPPAPDVSICADVGRRVNVRGCV